MMKPIQPRPKCNTGRSLREHVGVEDADLRQARERAERDEREPGGDHAADTEPLLEPHDAAIAAEVREHEQATRPPITLIANSELTLVLFSAGAASTLPWFDQLPDARPSAPSSARARLSAW